MGGAALAATPALQKQTEVGECNGTSWAVSSMQGWRTHMEDRHVVSSDFCASGDGACFSVFDGHGGDFAVKYCAQHLPDAMRQKCAESGDPQVISKALEEAVREVDATLASVPAVKQGDRSGTTAICAVVTGSHVIVSNVGDCRAVLGRGGETVELSRDHKPEDMMERLRIHKAGGQVIMKRVNGDLALSRAMGDFRFKQRTDLPHDQQLVPCTPDLTVEKLTHDSEFIIIACDGIWDMLTSDEACKFVRECLDVGMPTSYIVEDLLDLSFKLGSKDNMTCMIVQLKDLASKIPADVTQMPSRVESALSDESILNIITSSKSWTHCCSERSN